MASPTPAQFRAVHGDMGRWQAVDFDVYEHLVENQYVVRPWPRPEPGDPPPPRRGADPATGLGPPPD
ncbi:hypothetical protein [Streptomyces sp. NRRL S-244]|uniref:hypothetical protein n=1 Tax=Streptomyces sp. NRRL S-244 TaxID=1463897 RepID=UPI00131A4EF1|nr:hypothetical protein [Streptomyces sp. NRRL S-244]